MVYYIVSCAESWYNTLLSKKTRASVQRFSARSSFGRKKQKLKQKISRRDANFRDFFKIGRRWTRRKKKFIWKMFWKIKCFTLNIKKCVTLIWYRHNSLWCMCCFPVDFRNWGGQCWMVRLTLIQCNICSEYFKTGKITVFIERWQSYLNLAMIVEWWTWRSN